MFACTRRNVLIIHDMTLRITACYLKNIKRSQSDKIAAKHREDRQSFAKIGKKN